MASDPVDAEQATLETFTESCVCEHTSAVDPVTDRSDQVESRERPGRLDHLEDINARLRTIEQIVPGVDGTDSDWTYLTPSEKEAAVIARLVRLKIYVDKALPDDEPAAASRGFR